MLEKTLALLQGLAPGTFVARDKKVFDDSEIAELGHLLSKLIYAPSTIRSRLQEYGVTIVPANFYSQIPTVSELESSFSSNRTERFDYIFDDRMLLETLEAIREFSYEFDPPNEDDGSGYHWNNSQFSYSDAMAYYCMVRSRKPARIIEIGSGFSTQVASRAIHANGFGEIICIEPYPRPFLESTPYIKEIVKQPIQALEPHHVDDMIGQGDILFIDSTHTVKHDSDCIHIYLQILPQLRADVLVHAHDVFLPRTLSLLAMRDHQIHWTEQYLLYAYLMDNCRTRVCFSSSYSHMRHRALLDALMHGRRASGGGSIWFDQLGKEPPHITE